MKISKKSKKIILTIIIIGLIISIIVFLCNKKETKEINLKNSNKLAIILENDNGNVQTSAFPENNDTYTFHKVTCENLDTSTTNKIYKWDNENWKLNFIASSTTNIDGEFSCQIYFKPTMPTATYSANSTSNPYSTFTAPKTGLYKIELWGAKGGYANTSTAYYGGYGAYTSGEIILNKGEEIYIYVGNEGQRVTGTTSATTAQDGYNSGNQGTFYASNSTHGGGGGATDVRLTSGDWDNTASLQSRIMVAAGGGGSSSHASAPSYSGTGGAGGGLTGYNGVTANTTCYAYGLGGTQTAGGSSQQCASDGHAYTTTSTFLPSFGRGGGSPSYIANTSLSIYAGGGGGYYGGNGGSHAPGAGGSSYISGHTGCVAVQKGTSTPKTNCTTGTTDNKCSIHYSDYKFTNTVMIDGNGYSWSNVKGGYQRMPSGETEGAYYDQGVGKNGNGAARITQIKNSNDFVYTNKEQEYTVPKNGTYKIELWGSRSHTNSGKGQGGYTSGEIELKKNEKLYFYVGSQGNKCTNAVVGTCSGGYNGGAQGYVSRTTCNQGAYGGSGATDVRLYSNGEWNNVESLRSRIMVAGGAAGGYSEYCSTSDNANTYAAYGGGLEGYSAVYASKAGYSDLNPTGGTQIDGGQGLNSWQATSYITTAYTGLFGQGGTGGNSYSGGGGGYWGGASGVWQPGGGGSSYISGHTGCVAVQEGTDDPKVLSNGDECDTGTDINLCSIHYSNKVFTNTLMIDGAGYTWTNEKASTAGTNLMPSPYGGTYSSGVGHSGSGFARITYIGGS